MNFIFIRHGATDWTPESISLGPVNYPLNEEGVKQATNLLPQLKELLEEGKEIVLLSSPLQRALETAKIIATHFTLSIKILDTLQERYYGDARMDFTDAEPEHAFIQRIGKALRNIKELSEDQSKQVIVVSHAKVFERMSLQLEGEARKIGNCELHLFNIADKFHSLLSKPQECHKGL